MSSNEKLEIKDLHLAAYLLAKGFKSFGPVLNMGVVYFTFENTPELASIALKFYNKSEEILVNPLEFIAQLRTLHQLIEVVKRGGGQK